MKGGRKGRGLARSLARHQLPTTWNDIISWCAQQFDGKLMLHPAILRELPRARYEDVGAAAKGLVWLAEDYRRPVERAGRRSARPDSRRLGSPQRALRKRQFRCPLAGACPCGRVATEERQPTRPEALPADLLLLGPDTGTGRGRCHALSPGYAELRQRSHARFSGRFRHALPEVRAAPCGPGTPGWGELASDRVWQRLEQLVYGVESVPLGDGWSGFLFFSVQGDLGPAEVRWLPLEGQFPHALPALRDGSSPHP